MKFFQVPSTKVGTPYQRPSWRYDIVSNPQKYGLVSFCSNFGPDSGCLKRLIPKGVKTASVYSYPNLFIKIANKLPYYLNIQLSKVWNKYYKRNNPCRITYSSSDIEKIPISWNIKKVSSLNDNHLKRLIFHTFNYKYDADVDYAIKFYLSPENSEVKRYFGYSYYARIDDKEIAKRWHISVNRVKIIKYLFFDFTHFPTDRIASWVLLRQLTEIGEIEPEDYERYKKIFDLGELGLKMMVDYCSLSHEEKLKVETFLGSTAVMNTINLNMGIRSSKDALNYNHAIVNFARLSLYKEDLRQKEATIRLTELHISKAGREIGVGNEHMVDEDQKLLEKLRELSRLNATPKLVDYIDLDKLK